MATCLRWVFRLPQRFVCLRKASTVLKLTRQYTPETSTEKDGIFGTIPRQELVTKFRSKLKDRQFMPGSTGAGIPEFLGEARGSFPHGVRVLNPRQLTLAELTAQCMKYVDQHLPQYGAILFRDLPVTTAEDFSTIAKTSQHKALSYEGGGGFRVQVDKESGTYTASNEPPDYTIEMHNEMSSNHVYPSKVFLFCLKAPADGCGGETPVLKNSELLAKLHPDVVKKFEEKMIRYVRYLPDKSRREYLHWQHVFATENRKEAEERSTQQGYNFTWDTNGDLYLWLLRPAIIPHPVTGQKIWFNQAHSHNASYYKSLPIFADTEIPDDKSPGHSYYGDGSAIEPEVLQHIRSASWSCAVGFKWERSDLLVLDNLAVQHGRISFTGDRKILAFLAA